MKAALIALTKQGVELAFAYAEVLPGGANIFIHEHCVPSYPDGRQFSQLRQIMPELWGEYRLLIFIMATGIVIRHISPFLQGKDRDPAILVGDEAGRFIIPLLSGHLGGANAWANHLANKTGATAVITTATDVNGLVAPDEYARRLGWQVTPVANLQKVNSRFLQRGYLTVCSDYPLPKDHPLCLDQGYIVIKGFGEEADMTQGGITVKQGKGYDVARFRETVFGERADVIITPFPQRTDNQVFLIPPVLSVGVGCRRGVKREQVLEGLDNALQQIQASRLAIKGLYSIDRKADEEGLRQAADCLGVPFITFPAEEIQKVNEQRRLTPSDFVKREIGVDGVCEAASLLGTVQGNLILPKYTGMGLAFAVSQEKYLL
ncbi:MAG: cobalt-precorrin 5A hydrolase [Desulfitobacteriaceae bacterium]